MDYQPGTDVSDKSPRLADSWRFFVYESIGWPDDGWGDKEEAADDFLTKALLWPSSTSQLYPYLG